MGAALLTRLRMKIPLYPNDVSHSTEIASVHSATAAAAIARKVRRARPL